MVGNFAEGAVTTYTPPAYGTSTTADPRKFALYGIQSVRQCIATYPASLYIKTLVYSFLDGHLRDMLE